VSAREATGRVLSRHLLEKEWGNVTADPFGGSCPGGASLWRTSAGMCVGTAGYAGPLLSGKTGEGSLLPVGSHEHGFHPPVEVRRGHSAGKGNQRSSQFDELIRRQVIAGGSICVPSLTSRSLPPNHDPNMVGLVAGTAPDCTACSWASSASMPPRNGRHPRSTVRTPSRRRPARRRAGGGPGGGEERARRLLGCACRRGPRRRARAAARRTDTGTVGRDVITLLRVP
jgi:hypothetical protein